MAFNPESVLFSRKVNKPVHSSLYMNHQLINEVTYHKKLGLISSNDLSWHKHLDCIKTKTKPWSRINIMRKPKFKRDRKSLQVLYISFIRPLLEYVDVVWDDCAQYGINEIETRNIFKKIFGYISIMEFAFICHDIIMFFNSDLSDWHCSE